MDVDWGEVKFSSTSCHDAGISVNTWLSNIYHPFPSFGGISIPFTDLTQVHRLQLPASSAHISVIAFDTQQELLWTGDETVGHNSLVRVSGS